MKIHHRLERAADAPPLVLSIGFFDGVHAGHREIIRALLRLRRPGERAGVLTFSNHPSSYLRPGMEPPLITTLEERVTLLADTGIDELYIVRFDDAIASLPPERFLDDVLVRAMDVRALAVGENFRFGAKRGGDVAMATGLLGAQGRTVLAVPQVVVDGERVSSTRIRSFIVEGDVAAADVLLGAAYTLRGRVVLGEGRGHGLGFPTANLEWPAEKLLPMEGVYGVLGRWDGRDYPGLVSIGRKPTFQGVAVAVEAWLRDFRHTIYGDALALRDFRFVRPQRAFASVEELRVQMEQDATHVAFPTFAST